jgi:GTP-binding protein
MADPLSDVSFIGSFTAVSQCPDSDLPEYCFIGRSNVGKSSLINLLTGHRELARTSKKPGKTQVINLFHIADEPAWQIADLPGYGFAQVSKSMRQDWSKMINGYILERQNLVCVFLLVDIRHPMQENDQKFLEFLGEHEIPFCILFTKADKLKPAELAHAIDRYDAALLEMWELLPERVVTSSETGLGRDEVLGKIRQWNATFAGQAHTGNS